ncbi:tRNA (5-methylaminomethyl-2-thiouridine)(34)-methyltransferase MnmD [Scytonema sp. PRP1]|uniref:tRNA (5-methylaminomethyl-2-thiouridine)(34)-methyltransferase MnmD n=1 Tax=Scytonema sp. PRP1 TaxID=3120513 RepID=UPI002FD6E10A
MSDLDNFTPKPTADGSFTFFSHEFGESFHSHYGARQESFLKFVGPTQLQGRANKPTLRLLDVCYGLGYNTAAALQAIWAVNPNCYVEVIGLEMNAAVPQAAIAHGLFDNWGYEYTQILTQLAFNHQVLQHRLKATLFIGDARNSIKFVNDSGFQADAIFLDPFSPPHCPQLWTVEFIKELSMSLDVSGLLATYSCAAAVRTALLAAGLEIGSTPPVGRKTPGTVARHQGVGGVGEAQEVGEQRISPSFPSLPHSLTPSSPSSVLPPLSQAEHEHLLTRAAIAYRDPQLCDTADVILRRRQQEQQASFLEPTSRWRKRWLSKSLLEVL